MSKYKGATPGPWYKAEVRQKYDCIIRVEKSNDPICATFYAGYSKTEAEANIKLIADAPKLAERVEELEKANGELASIIVKQTEQNEKMPTHIKQECADCMLPDEPREGRCLTCETYKLIAEIEEA